MKVITSLTVILKHRDIVKERILENCWIGVIYCCPIIFQQRFKFYQIWRKCNLSQILSFTYLSYFLIKDFNQICDIFAYINQNTAKKPSDHFLTFFQFVFMKIDCWTFNNKPSQTWLLNENVKFKSHFWLEFKV